MAVSPLCHQKAARFRARKKPAFDQNDDTKAEAPQPKNGSTMAAPMPPAAPVTIATPPLNRGSV
jgi:hypothetical protein